MQVIEQEQSDHAPAAGVGHGNRTRDDRSRTSNKHVRYADPTPAPGTGDVGPRIAVPFANADSNADHDSDRIGSPLTDPIGSAGEP